MSFKAVVYKVGINAVVDVPNAITAKMKPVKGYIPVTGKINGYDFKQTLCPVKNSLYRLYVNIPMLKGGKAKLGDTAKFTLKQDNSDRRKDYPMVTGLKKQLTAHQLMPAFNALTEARKKDILRYIGRLKTEEITEKNIDKVINQLKAKSTNVRVP